MSGNVWEWVSTIYGAYPYKADNARESNSNTDSARDVRGGSWYQGEDALRAAIRRSRYVPDNMDADLGFRCARSY
jgi:formylglycine-generating enzyme required for sulfatase activity